MPRRDHTQHWIFDLDNTLYPRGCDLFAQIDVLITDYTVQVTGLERDAARRLQKDYYRDHGTTLNGLMLHHGIDPDHYLTKVHEIDYSEVKAHPDLVAEIERLPGRKYIFTNADAGHARAVLSRLGADGLFDGIFDIRDANYAPKPLHTAYDIFVERFNIAPERAVMFDDLDKNLIVPHQMGMRTVQVIADDGFTHEHVEDWELDRNHGADHIHHRTNDLAQFLMQIV